MSQTFFPEGRKISGSFIFGYLQILSRLA